MLSRSLLSDVVLVSSKPSFFRKVVSVLFISAPRPDLELNNALTVPGLLASAAFSAVSSIFNVPPSCSVIPIVPRFAIPLSPPAAVGTPLLIAVASAFLTVFIIESPSNGPPCEPLGCDLSKEVSDVAMLTKLLYAVTKALIDVCWAVVSEVMLSVWVVPTDSEVRLIDRPAIADVTLLVGLLTSVPATVSNASLPAAVCFQFADVPMVVYGATVLLGSEGSTVEVDELTLSFDNPELSPEPVGVASTEIPFATPVVDECSTRCVPSVPVITVALTPGLPEAELIAAAMPVSVLFDESILIETSEPPTESFSVPVPSASLAPNAPEVILCDVAMLVTWIA